MSDHPEDAISDPTFGNRDAPRGTYKPPPARPLMDRRTQTPLDFTGNKPELPNFNRDVDTFCGTAPKDLSPIQLDRNQVPGLKRHGGALKRHR